MKHLDWLDLFLFSCMLIVSALIGVYFAYFASVKQNTTSEYLMGGKSLGIFPVTMSLVASYMSGISLLGIPSEMYVYGTQYSMIIFSEVFVSITVMYIYLPVYYKLQLTTSYEYLQKRFGTSVKLLGCSIFLLKMLFYIPIVIYVPALAFSQVTGINLHLISPAVCAICILYTSLGGLKAVVWTDTFQIIIMFGGIIMVLVLGILRIGAREIYDRSRQSDRLEFFNANLDPRIRHTIWSLIIGNYFYWLATLSVNQAMIQRCLSLPSLKKAKLAVGLLAVGIIIIVVLCCLTGIVIYAMYHDCDPISTKVINKADQLVPHFVLDVADSVPGLPGIFLSGVFSAALSTMSTGLNSMTGVIFEDIIRPMWKTTLSEKTASLVMKITVVIIGIVCVILVFVVEQLGTLIQTVKSLSGITAGPLLGIFSLGMFAPWINEKGALVGGITGLCAVAYLSFKSQNEIALGNIILPTKPTTTTGCTYLFNTNKTTNTLNGASSYEPLFLFQLSYLWYAIIGTSITCVVSTITSYATGFNKPEEVNIDLLTPIVQNWFSNKYMKGIRKRENDVKLAGLSSSEMNGSH